MWNRRSLWLYAYIRLRGERPGFALPLPVLVALYVPYQLLLACDALLALIPGRYGVWSRGAVDTVQGLLLALMAMPPQTIADIDIRDGKKRLRVAVRTCGLGGGEQ